MFRTVTHFMHLGRIPLFCFMLIGCLALLFGGREAMALAPFCAQSNTIAPQCFYYDAKTCKKEADIIGGICVANQEAINMPEGYGNYCLVLSSDITQCLYIDYNSCNTEAKRQNGVCMRNFSKPQPLPSYEDRPENPYQTF